MLFQIQYRGIISEVMKTMPVNGQLWDSVGGGDAAGSMTPAELARRMMQILMHNRMKLMLQTHRDTLQIEKEPVKIGQNGTELDSLGQFGIGRDLAMSLEHKDL